MANSITEQRLQSPEWPCGIASPHTVRPTTPPTPPSPPPARYWLLYFDTSWTITWLDITHSPGHFWRTLVSDRACGPLILVCAYVHACVTVRCSNGTGYNNPKNQVPLCLSPLTKTARLYCGTLYPLSPLFSNMHRSFWVMISAEQVLPYKAGIVSELCTCITDIPHVVLWPTSNHS